MSKYKEVLPPEAGFPLATTQLTSGAGVYTPTIPGGSWHYIRMVAGGFGGSAGTTAAAGQGGASGPAVAFRVFLLGPVNYVVGAAGAHSQCGQMTTAGISAYAIAALAGGAAVGDSGGSGADSILAAGGVGATPTAPATDGGYGAGGGGGAKGTINTAPGKGGGGAIYIEEYGL